MTGRRGGGADQQAVLSHVQGAAKRLDYAFTTAPDPSDDVRF